MAQFVNEFAIDLKKSMTPQQLRQCVGEGDAYGMQVGARVFNGGEYVALGGSCVGKVIRADGATIQLTGTISGNLAYVILDQTCCAIEGPIQIAVCWVSSSNVTTLLVAYGTVVNTMTGNAIQPSTPIPDLTQLLAEIDAMQAATAAANAAAAGALDNFAGAFSGSTAYKAGQYVTYTDGKFYRFVVDHSAGAWNASDVVAVTVGGEVGDLKSAFKYTDILVSNMYGETNYGGSAADWINAVAFNADSVTGGEIRSSNTRIMFIDMYKVVKDMKIRIKSVSGYKWRILFAKEYYGSIEIGQTIKFIATNTGWTVATDVTVTVPSNCVGFCIGLAKSDDSDITPSDIPEGFSVTGYSLVDNAINVANNLYTTLADLEWQIGYYKSGSILGAFANGNWNINTTSISSSTTRCYAEAVPIEFEKVHLELPPNMKGRMNFFKSDGTIIPTSSSAAWTDGAFDYAIPTGAALVGVSVAYISNATISPSDCSAVYAYCYKGTMPQDAKDAKKAYVGKRLSILGDSISTFAGENATLNADGHLISVSGNIYTYPGNHCRYPNSYLSNVDDTYWMQLINDLGMVLGINDSWAGSRVTWNGTEGSDYGANIYIASPTRIGHLDDNGTPDIILVNAGTNDIGLGVTIGTFNTENPVNYTDAQIAALPVATFADAYRALLIRLQKAYPLAKIVVMLPDYTTSYYNPTTADQYLEIIKEACDFFGVPWVDMRTSGITMYNTATYTGDGIHPNVNGMALLYKKMAKFFLYSL